MIVDDELSLLKLYETLLSVFGHTIIGKAKNGEETVEMYKFFPNKPDVVIMDHRMPIKNGIEASKEILRLDKNARIIFTSADKIIEAQVKKLGFGIISFMAKPFSNRKLVKNVEKALKKYPLAPQ